MAANPERRIRLADAGLEVLAEQGARGLTHRAVDTRAGVPTGTASNYFSSRAALLGALADRIFERLQPAEEVVEELGQRTPDVELYADYMDDIVTRISTHSTLWIALLELRLEATRDPDLAARLGRTLTSNYANDLAHHRESGLPGGDASVILLHHAMNGLILDVLTPSIDAGLDHGEAVRLLVRRLAG